MSAEEARRRREEEERQEVVETQLRQDNEDYYRSASSRPQSRTDNESEREDYAREFYFQHLYTSFTYLSLSTSELSFHVIPRTFSSRALKPITPTWLSSGTITK